MPLPPMTPEEEAAVRQIAQQRAQLQAMGYTQEQADQAIFSGGAFPIAGGYQLAGLANDAASIASQYNLGRGNLALQASSDYYNQMSDPYNVVAANQFYVDQGGSPFGTDPLLANVPQSPGSRYTNYLDSILFPAGESGGSAGAPSAAGGAPSTITPGQQNTILQAYRDNPQQAEAFFSGASGTQARSPQQVQQSMTATTPAQSAAARGISGMLPGMRSTSFAGALGAGQVPGFSSINAKDFSMLPADAQRATMGLWGSTGRFSDPAQAYDQFRRIYGVPGSAYGGIAR